MIKGRLVDTADATTCKMVLASLLHIDSSLITSTYSDQHGDFKLSADILAGSYFVLVEGASYNPVYRRIEVKAGGEYDLGIIILTHKSNSLRPVTVTANSLRPRFRNDTIEFNTSNIKMNINANVEQLIGLLPGLKTGSDGEITYNGQKIQLVTVDGREMFGLDITLVTRNLNADMIAKIEVVDGKSKQAKFTGIDDGQRVKTLNLILKDHSRSEYFEKVGVGDGLNDYYHMGGVLGAFEGKNQVMIVGSAANTGNSGFGGSSNGITTNVFISSEANDPLGAEAGIGIPQSIGCTGHFSTVLQPANDPLGFYYRGGSLITHPFSSSLTEQILPDSLYIQSQQNGSVNSQRQQALDLNLAFTLDSLKAFQARLVGGGMRGNNVLNSTGWSSLNDTLTNSSVRSLKSDVGLQYSLGDVLWRMRMRHDRRQVFSIVFHFSASGNHTSGYLYSIDKFYQFNGLFKSSDTTDQRKALFSGDAKLITDVNFTTPLRRNFTLTGSYGLSVDNSHSQQFTYAKVDGKYQNLVDSLSDNYRDIFLNQRISLTLQGSGKNCDYELGTNLSDYNYWENDLLNDTVSKHNIFSIAPQLMVNFQLGSSTRCTVRYSGGSQMPSIAQLQPVQNNSNPLYITLGNPNLHPSYSHNIGLEYHYIGSVLFNLNWDAGITNNSINTKMYTDSLGRQISEQINTNGSDNTSLHASLSRRLKPMDVNVGLGAGASYSQAVNYIGDLINKSDNYTAGAEFLVEKYIANVYNFRVNLNFTYSSTANTISTANRVNYWTQNHWVQIEVFPVKNWEINTNLNYSCRQKTAVFENNNTAVLWNAGIHRNFLNNRLTAQFNVNDILGENAGISRSISANQITQSNSNVIGRYWMMSLLYQFNHKLPSR